MTPEQIKECEDISRGIILKNEPVFAKDASLAAAKAVQGLRAVFEEVSVYLCEELTNQLYV